MTHRERFQAIMRYQPVDRLPVYFFGTWRETKERWCREGAQVELAPGSGGPQLDGMDPDWESGMWDVHGMVNNAPVSPEPARTLEETDDYIVQRTPLGAVVKAGKRGSTPPLHIEPALKPTRPSWDRFKRFLDPDDPSRRSPDWLAKAETLNRRDRVATFLAGSLYGWPRDWMGVEALSYLAYDDPALLEEILDHLTEFFISLHRPVLQRVRFDFAYIFEDCCFNTGPLLSPAIYAKLYDRYYRRLIAFCREMGVEFVLLDSDGKTDALIGPWLDSGVDILFPIEVGTWKADPVELRRRFGRSLRMMGGVDKHVIPRGEAAVRCHLRHLAPLAAEGAYLPMPDHRIPPDCSLEQFRVYLRVFKEVFAAAP